MIEELDLILDTLNNISVAGEMNMNRLLGSIQHLRKVRDEIAKAEKGDES